MNKNPSHTIEEVAEMLRVSKLTVYDLIKKGVLPAYRVGRQMRVDARDIEKYKMANKIGLSTPDSKLTVQEPEITRQVRPGISGQHVIISGQDFALDLLGKYIQKHTKLNPLRLFNGSLNSLVLMYNGQCDIVSVHLYDGDSKEYNIPYVQKILVGRPFVLINLVCRHAGFYVQKGNPKHIREWSDLTHPHIRFVNREKGSGARILLDEQLRVHGISPDAIHGYDHELDSHFSVASAVASRQADVGVGIESVARMVHVDFVPMMKERYDLVILKTAENLQLLSSIQEILASEAFRNDLEPFNIYDLSLTGRIMFET